MLKAHFKANITTIHHIAAAQNARCGFNYKYEMHGDESGTTVAGFNQEIMFLIGQVADNGLDSLTSVGTF